MTAFHTIRKNIALGTVLAATGLPASLAQAQFKVEYQGSKDAPKAKSVEKTEKAEKTDQQVMVIKSDDGDHSYEVKVVNGIVKVAKLDGKELDRDRVKVKDETVVFYGDNGKVLHKIEVPGMAKLASSDSPKSDRGLTWVSNDEQGAVDYLVKARVEQPKVMLGINLSEPSDAMRKQLKLGSDQRVILVEKVIEGLPAQKAGLEDFDVILSLDGSDYANGELLTKVMSDKKPGDELKLIVLRGGDKLKLSAKLSAYNAKTLGVPQVAMVTRSGEDMEFPRLPVPPSAPSGIQNQGFASNLLPQIHEHLNEALHGAGLNDEEIAKVHNQLRGHIDQLSNRFLFSKDGDSQFEFEFAPHEGHDEHEEHIFKLKKDHAEHAQQTEQAMRQRFEVQRQLELAEAAKDKARQAMRDVERQVMEMRDGRLIVRSAERVEDQLGMLEDRLSALEERLEAQMDQFESQMERMADMFERMLDRLESRDD